jgi:predicted transcriptional regulator
MKTIQIELSDQQFDALKNLSEKRGKSIPDLLSAAVEQFLSTQTDIDVESALADIRAARGIWADRDDIGTTDEYVRNLRKGTAERLSGWGPGTMRGLIHKLCRAPCGRSCKWTLPCQPPPSKRENFIVGSAVYNPSR